MPNANFDNILSTTFAKHSAKFKDNVFNARPLAFYLKKAGNIDVIDGGHKIVEEVIIARNTTAGSYSGADVWTLQDTEEQEFTAAEFPWKQFQVNVRITGLDELKNSGTSRIIDLLASKITVAEESLISALNVMFHGNGTGNGGKDLNGLGNLVAQNASAVGGIDPTVDTNWASNINSSATALTLALMNTSWYDATWGADQPTFILTTQALFEKYEALLQPNLRYTDTQVADGGFQTLEYKGRPVVFDDDCPAGSMYMLNTKYLKLRGHKDKWFKPTEWFTPPNQDVRSMSILGAGNLTISSRRTQAVLTNKTA